MANSAEDRERLQRGVPGRHALQPHGRAERGVNREPGHKGPWRFPHTFWFFGKAARFFPVRLVTLESFVRPAE